MLTLAEFVLVLCSDGKKSGGGGGGARKKNRKQKKGPRSTSKTSTDAVEAISDRRPSGTATQVSETNDEATSSFDLPSRENVYRSLFCESGIVYYVAKSRLLTLLRSFPTHVKTTESLISTYTVSNINSF